LASIPSLAPILPSTPAKGPGDTPAPKRGPDAAREFEAFVLQNFIDAMLPKHAENVFGGGIAGAIWKSMLSEQLGAELARRGGLGIADVIRAAEKTGAPTNGVASAALEASRRLPSSLSISLHFDGSAAEGATADSATVADRGVAALERS
jgi:Rod binding domain-containing protein